MRTTNRNRALQGLAAALVLAGAGTSNAQTPPIPPFDSGSTGDDGDFNPTGTVYEFDPARITRVNGKDGGKIDPERDNVFHFKNINVPSTTTVRLMAKWTNGPVYWLASGNVVIAGDLQLSGESGYNDTKTVSERRIALPGPGGYPGGLGGRTSPVPTDPATPGLGPGGGGISLTSNCCSTNTGQGGKALVGKYLVPLMGGAGGGGSTYNLPFEWWGGGGGAGAGAILISAGNPLVESSGTITVSGRILANGGTGGRSRENINCVVGGSGAGGSIRLVGRTLNGSGSLQTSNGGGGCWPERPTAQDGKVRLEAFQHSWGYSIPYGSYSTGSPLKSFVPSTPPPSVVVTHVDGTELPNPKGEFTPADITINKSGSVQINVVAKGVPLKKADGSDVKVVLHLFALEALNLTTVGNDQIVESTALAQGANPGEATATITVPSFPPGFTRGYVRVKW
jgi:hypothetical protein